MTIQKAREILGEKGKKYTDEQIQRVINNLTVIAEIAIDQMLAKEEKRREEKRREENK